MKVFLIGLALTTVASGAGFDAASVRANASGLNSSSIDRSGSRITIENASLREIIFFAYGIPWGRDYELFGPDWLDGEKFDIIATFPPGPARERVQEMLQTLLYERFGLRTHAENRKLESYVLLIGKRGPKLQPNTTGAEEAFIFGEDRVTCRAISMAGLADRLSGPVFKLGRPVVDTTGIEGAYDFTLNWSSDTALAGPSIFTALEEQLGLRLVARKTAFRIVVIDHMDRVPTGQ
jgi:uncharacterized protein (TIGR03435 family)